MRKFFTITIIIFCSTILFPQIDSNKTEINSGEPRSFFINSSLGILEFISLGVGYQFSEKVAVTIKGSYTFTTGASLNIPNWGEGLGFKVSFSTEFLFINSISAEYIAYLKTALDDAESIDTAIKGNYFDFNIGREDIYSNGLNFFWAVGLCISAVKNTNVLYSPSLKIGLNYNFR
jgi:hypothetical protein